MDFYLTCLKTAPARNQTQLGLGRIGAEASMTLDYVVIDGHVEITAETMVESHDDR